MTPYYEEDGIVIYHGDCRDIMPALEPVDLVLTDPPYGINYNPRVGKKYNGTAITHTKIIGDESEMNFSFILDMECDQLIFGAENFYKQLPHRGRWICWYKRPLSWRDNCRQTSDFELAWMNKKTGPYKYFKVVHSGCINANSVGKSNNDTRLHPTEKPIPLLINCINLFKEPQTILDPFMGSGTTLRAAKDLGRKAIGIELEEKYCEIAVNRLRQQVLDL